MISVKYRPPPPLSDFVELFWYSEKQVSDHSNGREAILPDGCADLVINLSANSVRIFDCPETESLVTMAGTVFCGPRSSPYGILPDAAAVIGVHFRPGGVFPFLPMPAEELRNIHLTIDTLYGACAGELREQLVQASPVSAKFAILEQFLLRQMTKPLALHRVIGHAVHRFQQNYAVASVLQEVGLSARRFSRVFSEQVGLTPKIFHRVQRFQKTIASLPMNRHINWSQVAFDSGYCDQAHLIHEFRSFCFVTPTAFVARNIAQRNHLPLPR
ncbi:MAG: transcriptional regulator, AraC family [Spartobacteria bacterium]|nr:transcriptional regulator, AraC family [Spartobacteria bacterium]